MIVVIMRNIMVLKKARSCEQEKNKKFPSELCTSFYFLWQGPSWCWVFSPFPSFSCLQVWEDCYCFVSPLFYILPLSFSICPIILTTSSEYWPPNLPGQPVFSSKFRTIFSRLLDISTIITSFQCMLIWGFILITLPSQSLLVSPLYLLYNIKVIRV